MTSASELAYPCPEHSYAYGLTKREYFAAKAMIALIPIIESKYDRDDGPHEEVAKQACLIADALIAELNKPTGIPINHDVGPYMSKEDGERTQAFVNDTIEPEPSNEQGIFSLDSPHMHQR